MTWNASMTNDRTLMSICLRRDFYEGGCNNIVPSKLNDCVKILNKEKIDMNLVVVNCATKKLNASYDLIKTLSDSITRKPCNEVPINQCSQAQKHECLHDEPSQLSTYLEEFANLTNESCEIIKDEHLVLCCKGCCDVSDHTLLCSKKETSS